MNKALKAFIGTALMIPATVPADINHLPQPWRQEAVVLGPTEPADTERFLHELTFDHSQPSPSLTENGVRGTGGSVGSRRLYLDFRFRQDFSFNEDNQGFLLDIQRSEDFDGSYDRQLVGFRHQLTEATEVWLQGNVFADKSRADIYFSGRHTFANDTWLHASWILPDAYFNDKTETDDVAVEEPHSFFAQWHLPPAENRRSSFTASATYSPPSTFDSRSEGLVVENETLRGALTYQHRVAPWHLQMELSGERTRRQFRLDERAAATPMERNHLEAEFRATLTTHRLQPGFGIHYLHLTEQGYTGRKLDEFADVHRREPVLSGSFALPMSPAVTLKPAIYLSSPDINADYSQSDDEHRQGFAGKLALPVEIQLSREENAVLTLAPTLYLHEAAFGGGNLQLHWPL